jgi:tripartite ATP-independent transporter DctM subunit
MSGLIMMAAFMLTVAVTARIRKFPRAREHRASLSEIAGSLKETIWALIFPIVLIGSLRLGLFTPSEVGAFACVYAIIVGFFVYKEMTIKSLIITLKEAIRDIGGIMFMISMSAIFAYGIPMDQIPQKLTTLITGFTNSQFVVMGIIFLLYVIFGMFMDGSIVILLLTPILMPIVRTVGIDPVLFGVVTSIIVTMGILTPPVGIAMYIVNGILGVKMSEYLKESIPFFVVVILVGILLLAIPDVILFLPNLVYGVAS